MITHENFHLLLRFHYSLKNSGTPTHLIFSIFHPYSTSKKITNQIGLQNALFILIHAPKSNILALFVENMLNQIIFLLENYVVKHKIHTFASVFHGIRFKVRRLFVGMTDNFFCAYSQVLKFS